MCLGPDTSQENLKKPKSRPRDTQGTQKHHAKKCQKTITKNASVVKNALSRRSHSWRFLAPIFAPKIAPFLKQFLHYFFKTCYKNVETRFGTQLGIRAAQESQN